MSKSRTNFIQRVKKDPQVADTLVYAHKHCTDTNSILLKRNIKE